MEPITTMMLIAAGCRALGLFSKSTEGQCVFSLVDKAVDSVVNVIELTFNKVQNWFSANKIASTDVGRLFREKYSAGNYKIVGGVFNDTGQLRKNIAWECSLLDPELQRKLSQGQEIEILI